MQSSLRKTLQDADKAALIEKSIHDEIGSLDLNALRCVLNKDIPESFRKDIIDTYMFHKEKFKANGEFDKHKCRLVLRSDQRDHDNIGESFSPTVNPISVMTQLNLAATTDNTLISAYDIFGAFLITPVKQGSRYFIKVNPDVVKHWIKKYPGREKFVNRNGCLYFELKTYVYGLHESPREFNTMLDKDIQALGFKPSKVDPCLYIKKTKYGNRSYLFMLMICH